MLVLLWATYPPGPTHDAINMSTKHQANLLHGVLLGMYRRSLHTRRQGAAVPISCPWLVHLLTVFMINVHSSSAVGMTNIGKSQHVLVSALAGLDIFRIHNCPYVPQVP